MSDTPRIYSRRLPRGTRLAATVLARADVLALDWDTRQKSRFDAHTAQGERVLVVLPRGQVLRGGDVLVADDGALLRIEAAPQPGAGGHFRMEMGPQGLNHRGELG